MPSPVSKNFVLFIFILCVSGFAYMNVYAPCMLGAQVVQKRASNPPELELQMVVNHMWVLGIKPGSSTRGTSALNHRSC